VAAVAMANKTARMVWAVVEHLEEMLEEMSDEKK
jgi:hypothetical protein